jgi:phosphoribosylanthranilate isomerase
VSGRRHTTVKVCGITRLEDARAAVEAGADWLGFVLWEGSPRRIDFGAARAIADALPGALGVAVLVAPTPDEALALAERTGARRVQLHRVDPAAWPGDFPLPVTFAVPVEPDGRLAGLLPVGTRHLVLLDTAHARLPGGTGRHFAWGAVTPLAAARPVMLAGGLDGESAAAAVEAVRPFGVDASSRLESAPGIKDPERVRRFVAAVRECDARLDLLA